MIKLFNKKTGQIQDFSTLDATISLRLEPDIYLPLEDSDYYVKAPDGVYHKTKGKDLLKVIGDTDGSLADKSTAEVDLAVRAENSAGMEALKGFVSEAFLLGLDRPFLRTPQTPEEIAYEKRRQELFGGAETAGRVAGNVLPFLFGGLAGVARGSAKKALTLAGKAPSAQILRYADKAGKATKEMARKAGAKKTGQALAGAVGLGAGLSALEAGLSGVKTGIATYRKPKFQGEKKVRSTVTESLLAGTKSAGETFATTSALMSAFAGGVLFTKGTLRATKEVRDMVFGPGNFGPAGLRSAFFRISTSPSGRKGREILNRKISNRKDTQETAIRKLMNFLKKQKLTSARDRNDMLNKIELKLTAIGKVIGRERERLAKEWTAPDGRFIFGEKGLKDIKHQLIIGLLKLKVRGPGSGTIYNNFNNTIDKVVKTLSQDKRPLTPATFNELMDIFSRYAKYTKREKSELKVDLLFRKAYAEVSKTEDDVYAFFKKYFEREFKKKGMKPPEFLKDKKDVYARLLDVKEIVQNASSSELRKIHGWDRILLGGAGGALGAGIPGAVAGVAAASALSGAQNIGYRYLQLAKVLERANRLTRQIRVPGGVKNLLKKGSGTDVKMSLPGVGLFLLQRNINTLDDLSQSLDRLDEWDKTSRGNEDLLSMTAEYGGRANFAGTAVQISRVKQAVIQSIPPLKQNAQGKLTYDKEAERLFLQDINRWITPIQFVNTLQQKGMTIGAYNRFGALYPNFLSHFNLSFWEGVRNGIMDDTDGYYYKRFLEGTNSGVSDLLYSMLEYPEGPPGTGVGGPRRKMTRTQPTISESVEGGIA